MPGLDPTRTAIGTWSGGRFMHFGEPLDDERLTGAAGARTSASAP